LTVLLLLFLTILFLLGILFTQSVMYYTDSVCIVQVINEENVSWFTLFINFMKIINAMLQIKHYILANCFKINP